MSPIIYYYIKTLLTTTILITSLNIHAQHDTITHNGLNRGFLLHLPEEYSGESDLPLIIAMHGGFGSPNNIQNQSQLSVKADEEGFIVVYPEGVKGGVLDIRTWNAGWCCGHASNTDIDDVGFISALMDTLISEYAIDTTRIYATGMSNGGFLSYRLACELSDRIAAIAPVAASMSMVECNPTRPVPVISFHSFLDSNIPYEGGVGDGVSDHYNSPQDSILNTWATNNKCQALNDTITDNAEYTEIHWGNCDCISEVQHIITTDGGHSWPGGRKTATGDEVSEFINANDLMWDFFQQFTLDCNQTSSIDNITQSLHIKIYPNPASKILNIDFPENYINQQVFIYNINGQEMMKASNVTTIDVSDLSNGVYFLMVNTDGIKRTGKFLKTK
ncbi:MAG: T9SS type A sorting domain-containing protein [Saprospiraceae bacterium]|nr:T9SS type A sorting domain-containing protein [Saprospiraceae bacterium]